MKGINHSQPCSTRTLPLLRYLGDNNIDNEWGTVLVTALHTNSSIIVIYPNSNNIGNELLAVKLAKNDTATETSLYINDISDEGENTLAAALCTNSTLTLIDLRNDRIGNNRGGGTSNNVWFE